MMGLKKRKKKTLEILQLFTISGFGKKRKITLPHSLI